MASAWAHSALKDKNSLNAGDAKAVEDAFEQKLEELARLGSAAGCIAEPARGVTAPGKSSAVEGGHQSNPIDKGSFSAATPRRRSREHLRFVMQQPCLVCGRIPSDAHHLRFMQPRALGRKVSDEFAVPLCRGHHRALHRAGDELPWWQSVGIDPVEAARKLWEQTHTADARLPDAHQIGPFNGEQRKPTA